MDDRRKTIVLDQPWQIELYRLQVIRARLRLEMAGMQPHSSAIRMNTYLKRKYGWRGHRAHLLRRLEELIAQKELEAGVIPRTTDE